MSLVLKILFTNIRFPSLLEYKIQFFKSVSCLSDFFPSVFLYYFYTVLIIIIIFILTFYVCQGTGNFFTFELTFSMCILSSVSTE